MRRSTAGGIKCGVIAGNADSTVTPQSRGASHVALTPVLGRALAAPDAVRLSRQPVFETIAKNADTCKHAMLLLPLSTLPLLCGLRAARAAQTARSGRQSSGRPGGRCSASSKSVRPRVPLPPPPPLLHPIPVCRESCIVCVYVVCVREIFSNTSSCLCVWT